MIDSQENFKQIEDIIDARKKMGQYNVYKQPPPINYRYAYSTAATSDKFTRFDDNNMFPNEGDFLSAGNDLKDSDSQITVVRMCCDGLNKRRTSKWDMHDIAIPGDGSHLGESPSMVNLATLVEQNDEYLVPLSSWDPYYNNSENRVASYLREILKDDENNEDVESTNSRGAQFFEMASTQSEDKSEKSTASRRSSFAGKISKFLRKHCKKSKTLPEPYEPK